MARSGMALVLQNLSLFKNLCRSRSIDWLGTRPDRTTVAFIHADEPRRRSHASAEADPDIKDGVYELFYSCDDGGGRGADSLLLVMRQGRLIGADRWGGLVTGRCEFDRPSRRHRFLVELDVPRDGILVTGAPAPCAKQSIELVADLSGAPYNATGMVELFGERISLELLYRGPVPLPPDGRRGTQR